MEKNEFAVGEEFQFGLKRLRVEAQDYSEQPKGCDECVFRDTVCDDFADYVGDCRSAFRSDETNVFFVEVK